MLNDDVITSTNDRSRSEDEVNLTRVESCDLSFENILGDKVICSEVRLHSSDNYIRL